MVTATYVTDKANVIDLTFENSDGPIGTTAEHPFWSETRQKFVDAGKLEIGEEVLTLNGQRTRLSDITPRAGPETVYNFEVANQHVYYVSRDGLLVHNAVYVTDVLGKTKHSASSYMQAIQNAGKSLTPAVAKRLGSKIHGHHIVMKGAFRHSPEMRRVLVESRLILHRAGIRGKHNVANMAFAKNGDHSLAYAKSVLAKQKDGQSKNDVAGALDDIATELGLGNKFRFGGF